MDNTTSLFIGAALGFIVGLEIASFLRRRNGSDQYKVDRLTNEIKKSNQQLKKAVSDYTPKSLKT